MIDLVRVRSAKVSDWHYILEMALLAKPGMTSLIRNEKQLKAALRMSSKSFSKHVAGPEGHSYYFVMERMDNHEIIGVCNILDSIGFKQDKHVFEIAYDRQSSTMARLENYRYLQRSMIDNGPSEIGALYLKTKYRKGGLGRFLSMSRFLFMATHRQRFKTRIIAEMRGVNDRRGQAPFWSGLGKRFCQISFKEAIAKALKDPFFIESTVPRTPIYTALLDKSVTECIGKTHDNTVPALHLLQREGFALTNFIDIFDGGPTITAERDHIRTIREACFASVTVKKGLPGDSPLAMIAPWPGKSWQLYCGPVQYLSENTIAVSRQVANTAKLKEGSSVVFSPLKAQTFPQRFGKWYSTVETSLMAIG